MGRKIAVLGTGANGASIGADLTMAGEDVVFIEQWPAHVEAMRAHGVTIRTPSETKTVDVRTMHLCEVATLRHKFDVVLMLMKAYDSRWAAQFIEPYVNSDALVAGIQNGMSIDDIATVVGSHRTMGCVIEITSEMFEPGIIERHSDPSRSWFAVGSIDSTTKGREEEIAGLLRNSGSVSIVDDIRAVKWMKIVSNSTTLATTAIVGLPMIEAAGIPEMRRFMLQSGQEALDATLMLGNPILPIFGLIPNAVSEPSTVVEALLDTLLEGFVLPKSITTILQDWMKGRRSEVENINGLVASTHRDFGLRAPVNEAVVEVAHRIERGELEPGMANLGIMLDLATR
jgi:2-dehydropantoate 2-reductase